MKTKPNLTLNPQPSSLNRLNSVWDGDWAVLEEYTTGNVLIQKYLQGYHGLVKTLQNNIYYYQDELGSTSHIAGTNGALLEYYKYDLYGKPIYWSALNTQLSTSSYNVVDLFAGQRWLPQLSLYDDRNRFMSPDLGRFLQPDPIGFKGDASNLYRYCGNDWANKSDLMGLDWEVLFIRDYVGAPPNSPKARTAPGTWSIVDSAAKKTVYATRANENGFLPLRNNPNVSSQGVREGDYKLLPRGDSWGKSNITGVTREQPSITGKQPGLKPGQPDKSYGEPVMAHLPGAPGQADSRGCPTMNAQGIARTEQAMKENMKNGAETRIHIQDGRPNRAQPVTDGKGDLINGSNMSGTPSTAYNNPGAAASDSANSVEPDGTGLSSDVPVAPGLGLFLVPPQK